MESVAATTPRIGAWPTEIAIGHGLPLRPPFAPDDVAVLAGLDEHAERLLVVHHDAIGAEIDPVAVEILGDDEAFGADVVAAVVRVPFRRRKFA